MDVRSYKHRVAFDQDLSKAQVLGWVAGWEVFCMLDGHNSEKGFGYVLGFGVGQSFTSLSEVQLHDGLFKMGFLGYDLKNEFEPLTSENKDFFGFDDLYFFAPQYVLTKEEEWCLYSSTSKEDLEQKKESLQRFVAKKAGAHPPVKLTSTTSKLKYINTVKKIQGHLQQGDFYEMNYCINFSAKLKEFDWVTHFLNLNVLSKAPFSCLMRKNDQLLLCFSPERFMQKKGDTLISEPIKGTRKRGGNEKEDAQIKQALKNDEKERSENIMIVDLVRNDFSKIAQKSSVQVNELCEIYSFEGVHQMISSIQAKVGRQVSFEEIIKAMFPMGSMTGAPKTNVMQHIEKYECFKRGIYSGSVGYIDASGNFDFNVVIRSLVYNALNGVLSLPVGGAITIESDAEKEYEEVLVKSQLIRAYLA